MGQMLKKALLALETACICVGYVAPVYANADLSWLQKDSNGTFDEATASFKALLSSAYGLVMVVAAGLMVIFLILAAISYAAGSARAKDEAKSKVFGVFIGCFLVFAAVSLVSMIAAIANGAFT